MTHDEESDCFLGEVGVRGDHLPVVEDGVDPFKNGRHCGTSAGVRRWYTRGDEDVDQRLDWQSILRCHFSSHFVRN